MLLVVLAALFCHYFKSRTGGIYFLMSLNVYFMPGCIHGYLMGGPAGHTLKGQFQQGRRRAGQRHGVTL